MNRGYITIAAISVALVSLLGCTRQDEKSGPRYSSSPIAKPSAEYRFAVHPLHNPAKLIEAYQPLVTALNTGLPEIHFELEASRDYGAFEEKYKTRKLEFILPNPWQTLQAMKAGYHVIAMAGDPKDFKGIFVVRIDANIRTPADLKGKAVSYPAPTALAACILPQAYLHRHGIDIDRDIENRYVGSQESSIMNVYLRTTMAGATWPPPWRAFQHDHPREAADLRIIWETESLVNNSVMVRDDIPQEIAARVQAFLAGLSHSAEGRTILSGMETARFTPATDREYDTVRSYIARFERQVRRVEVP